MTCHPSSAGRGTGNASTEMVLDLAHLFDPELVKKNLTDRTLGILCEYMVI
jgi:hypothetical protein